MAVQSTPKLNQTSLFGWNRIVALLLIGVCCILIVVIIQLQHGVRHLETQFSKSLSSRVDLQEEKGKLLLEKYHLTALAKVEEIAKETLSMARVTADFKNSQTIYLNRIEADDHVVQ